MSYAASAALQAAVHARLLADEALAALVGDRVFDAPPRGRAPESYIVLGPEQVRDASDGDGAGALHELQVSVLTSVESFHAAKTVAGAVCDALASGLGPLTRGTLVYLNFLRARASRDEAGQMRRIDLTFAARIQDH